MVQKTAIISGVTGQDGSFLAEWLLERGYRVIGLKRRTSLLATDRIDHILYHDPNFDLKYFDLSDSTSIWNIIEQYKPDEFYNLAAQSHVKVSFEIPEYTVDVNAIGTLKILEAIKKICPTCKFYQASSSEMFGISKDFDEKGYTETSQMIPASPYGCSKLFCHTLCQNYRASYNMFICSGILFNHESERRGETFVTQKIVKTMCAIKQGRQSEIRLGNIDAYRDWGFAGDYVRAMWMMMQHDKPDDYVIATGETHTVREFLEIASRILNMDYKKYLVIDPIYFRPQEVPYLLGNATKAKTVLSWKDSVSFYGLIKRMIEYEVKRCNMVS